MAWFPRRRWLTVALRRPRADGAAPIRAAVVRLPVLTPRLALVVPSAAALLTALRLAPASTRAAWLPTGAGPYDYTDPANWAGGVIDGVFNQALTVPQTITLPGTTPIPIAGWTWTHAGPYDLFFQGDGAVPGTPTPLLLTGDVSLASQAGNRTVTLGGATGQNLALQLSGTRTFSVAKTDQVTVRAALGDAPGQIGGLTKTGPGTLALRGAIGYTGGTTVAGGTLDVALPNPLGDVSNQGTLVLTTTADATYSGLISGTGNLTKAGAGTLVLTQAQSYTGSTSVTYGTLKAGVANMIAASSGLTLNSTFDTGGLDQTVQGLNGSGGVTVSKGAFTVLGNGTYNGVITGGGAFVKSGPGTLVFGGTAVQTGGTVVQGGGVVAIASYWGPGDSLGPPGGLLTLDGGTLRDTGGDWTLTINRPWFLGPGGGTVEVTGSFEEALVLSSAITGPGGLTTGGTGIVYLRGANTYAGVTTVAAGALIANLSSLPGDVVNRGALAITTTGDGAYAGLISSTGGFEKQGSGTLVLLKPQTYTGQTWVDGGTLKAGAANMIAASSQLVVSTSGTFDTGGFDQTINELDTVNEAWGPGTLVMTKGVLTVQGGGAFAGVISGGGTLTKTGPSPLTLSGANTYTGGTIVQGGGVLVVTSDSSLGASTGAVTLDGGTVRDTASGGWASARAWSLGAGGGTVEVAANALLTLNGAISGPGGLTKTGLSILYLRGTNTYTGGTTIASGTLDVGPQSLPGDVVNQGTLTFTTTSDAPYTYSGLISSTGQVQKAGSGTLVLGGVNTYAGATTVNGGTLQAGLAGALPATTALTVSSGATFDLGGFDQAVGSLSGTGTVTLGTASLTVGGSNTSTTFAGTLSGAGGLIKRGGGTSTMGSANTAAWTYTGPTRVAAGTARAGRANVLPATTALTIDAGATFDLGGYNQAIGSLAGAGTVTTGFASGTLTIGGDDPAPTFFGTIGGAGGLAKSGSGTLTLGAPSTSAWTYTGPTRIMAGTLRPGKANLLPPTTALTVDSGATFDLAGYNQTVGSLAGAGTVALGAQTLTLGGTSTATTFSGTISGTGGLIKTAGGTVTLTGANTFSGGVTFQGGMLGASTDASLGAAAAGLTIDGGALQFAGVFDPSATRPIVLGPGGGTFDTSGYAITLTGILTGSGPLIKSGSGTLTLTNVQLFTGGVTFKGGVLAASGDAMLGAPACPLTFDGGTLQLAGAFDPTATRTVTLLAGGGTLDTNGYAATCAGTIGGSGGLTKAGGGTLILGNGSSGAFAYTGPTHVAADTLRAGRANVLPSQTAVTVDFGAVVDLAGYSQTVGSLSGNGSVTLGAGTLTVGANNTSTTFGGTISGNGGLVKSGSGTLTLTSNQTFTGGLTVARGAVAVDGDGRLGASSGALTFTGGTLRFLSTFSPIPTRMIALSSGGGTLDTNGYAVTLTNTVTGSGGLAKAGANTLTLGTSSAGTFSYTGPTYVAAGTLHAGRANVLPSQTALTVYGGATFDLAGYSQTVGSLSGSGTVALGVAALTAGGDNTSTIFGGTIGGSGGLIKSGSGTLTLTSASSNTFTGGITVQGGVVAASGDADLGAATGPLRFDGGTLRLLNAFAPPLTRTIAVNAGGGTLDTQTYAISLSGSVSGPGILTKTGAGSLTAGDLTLGGLSVNQGATTIGNFDGVGGGAAVTVAAGSGLTSGYVRNASVNLAGTAAADAKATLTPTSSPNTRPTVLPGLSIAGAPGVGGAAGTYCGTLDVGNNDLAVAYAPGQGPAVLAAIADMVRSAAAVPTDGSSTTPTWTGKGITSSNVKTEYFIDGPGARVLGVYDNNYNGNDTPYFTDGTLDGVSLGSTPAEQANHVIVKYLYVGDLNGDGLVNGADYNVIDNAFVRQSRGESFVIDWQTGDLNGDGILNGVDYNCIDNAELKWMTSGWNVTGPPPPGASPSPAAEPAGADAVAAALAPVPEPGAGAVLLMLAAGMLARPRNPRNPRRRRRRIGAGAA